MISIKNLTKDAYKTGEVGKMLNLKTRTIQYYCESGKLVSYKTPTNRNMVLRDDLIDFLDSLGVLLREPTRIDVIYARVSTNKQKSNGDLDRQVDKISSKIISCNPKDLMVFKEVGSGLNDNRNELNKLLNLVMDDKIDRIFILYKDRLTRFGFNYLSNLCKNHNTEIVTVSEDIIDKSLEEELAEDIISIIHSFSDKLYGMRKEILSKTKEVLE